MIDSADLARRTHAAYKKKYVANNYVGDQQTEGHQKRVIRESKNALLFPAIDEGRTV